MMWGSLFHSSYLLIFPENLLQLCSWAKLPLGDSQHSLFIIMLILCKKASNREKGDLGIFYPYIL